MIPLIDANKKAGIFIPAKINFCNNLSFPEELFIGTTVFTHHVFEFSNAPNYDLPNF